MEFVGFFFLLFGWSTSTIRKDDVDRKAIIVKPFSSRLFCNLVLGENKNK